jgi:hypothetical protein
MYVSIYCILIHSWYGTITIRITFHDPNDAQFQTYLHCQNNSVFMSFAMTTACIDEVLHISQMDDDVYHVIEAGRRDDDTSRMYAHA